MVTCALSQPFLFYAWLMSEHDGVKECEELILVDCGKRKVILSRNLVVRYLVCQLCNERFPNLSDLKDHKFEDHAYWISVPPKRVEISIRYQSGIFCERTDLVFNTLSSMSYKWMIEAAGWSTLGKKYFGTLVKFNRHKPHYEWRLV
jgi:hypothetical protein